MPKYIISMTYLVYRQVILNQHIFCRCSFVLSPLLARLVSKKKLRYCHSPSVVIGGVVGDVRHLTFSNISVITEDIYLKLREVVHYQKGNS